MMPAATATSERAPLVHTARYAGCIEASKRVRRDIERDVIRGRRFDLRRRFLRRHRACACRRHGDGRRGPAP